MSTGRRLAKRSIIGTRVCAPGEDGKYYSGVIQAVKTPASFMESNNCIHLTPHTRYTVRFNPRQGNLGRTTAEFLASKLIGPGFNSILGLELVPDQKCFITHNGREVAGLVCVHHYEKDQVIIRIHPPGSEAPFEVQKRLDEVRLLESRKSARLADQDQDFAILADMVCDRRKMMSHIIDVPISPFTTHGSRKRRPSFTQEDPGLKDPQMDECSAALVLMSLSGSPHSPHFNTYPWLSPSPDSSSSSASNRSTPSPSPRAYSPASVPLSSSSISDEGIVMDYYPEEHPRKKKIITRIVFQCTWPACLKTTDTCEAIEAHVRDQHLDHPPHAGEEEFYYTEIELGVASPPPTLSHRDMARPPHEDPDYQRQLVENFQQNLFSVFNTVPQSPHKVLKLSPRPHSPKTPSPRRVRGENKKCRKVYGMDHRELWCTQCKWKKACSRFGD